MIEGIQKSNTKEHYYTEREKKEALEEYTNVVGQEIDKIQALLEERDMQRKLYKNKDEQYDFERLNELEFSIKQGLRIIKSLARDLEARYNTKAPVPDYEASGIDVKEYLD